MRKAGLFVFWLGFWFTFFWQQNDLIAKDSKDLELSRQYNNKGARLFEEERFQEAALKFEKAYEWFPNPDAAFNAALAYDRAGDYRLAIKWYRTYLSEIALNNPKLTQKQQAEIDKVNARIAYLEKLVSAAEQVSQSASGKSEAATATPVAEDSQSKKLEEELVTLTPTVSRTVSRPYLIWKWGVSGFAVAALATGLGLNLAAVSQAREANNLSPTVPNYPSRYHSEYHGARQKMAAAYVLYGVGAAAAVAAGVLWYLDLHNVSQNNPSVSFAPVLDSNFGGGGVFVYF